MFFFILFLIAVGLFALLGGLAYLSIVIEEYFLNKKLDFESRLHKGEILHKGNIF